MRPKAIVNAAGPWIDRVNHALGLGKSYIGGAKGSHLVLDNPALVEELKGRMVYYGGADGRVSLVYPFFGHALVGSTDIPCDDPDQAICDEAEIGLYARRAAQRVSAHRRSTAPRSLPLLRRAALAESAAVRTLARSLATTRCRATRSATRRLLR